VVAVAGLPIRYALRATNLRIAAK